MNKDNQIFKGDIFFILSLVCLLASCLFIKTNHGLGADFTYIMFFILLLIGSFINLKVSDSIPTKVASQYLVLFGAGALFWNSAAYRLGMGRARVSSIGVGGVFSILLILNISFVVWCYISISKGQFKLHNIGLFLKKNWEMIAISLGFWILNFDTFSWWYRTDSFTYFNNIQENCMNWDFTPRRLDAFLLGGHSCYGYSLFAFIGNYLIPTNGIGIRVVNYLMLTISIFMFRKIILHIFPSMNSHICSLVIAIFTFSPLMFGINYEINTDFPCVCFFIWFVYFHITHKYILLYATSVLLCFSKETGILYMLAYCGGCYLYRIVHSCKKKESDCHIISIKELPTILSAVLFVVNWKLLNAGWAKVTQETIAEKNSDRSISIRADYIIIKLEQMFVMNFHWIILLLFLIAGLVLVIKRKKIQLKINETYIGLLMAFIVFMVFGSVFFTFAHYRYMQFGIIFLMILLVQIVDNITQRVGTQAAIYGIILGLFLLQSYVTIDPISFLLFKNADIGNGKMISTAAFTTKDPGSIVLYSEKEGGDLSSHLFGDFSLYNRQIHGFEEVFEEFLTEINYNEKQTIVFPNLYNGEMDYTIQMLIGRFDKSTCYWNPQTGNMTTEKSDIPIQWSYPDEVNDALFEKYEKVWFANINYNIDIDYNEYLANYQITNDIVIEKYGWKLEMLELARLN